MKTTSSAAVCGIEPLESRIAPAILNPAGTVLTYTDVDGDFVKVTFTGATMLQTDFNFGGGFIPGVDTVPQPLVEVNLTGKTGAGFTLTATPKAGKGDSHANINSINATGTDVGTIKVDGDVVGIVAGSGVPGTVGLKSFSALSFGQATTGSSTNTLKNVGSFAVKTDVSNTTLNFTGGVKSLSIGGNLEEFGGDPAKLDITGDVGSLKIGGSVIGRNSGTPNILISGATGTFSIGGSIVGGDTDIANFDVQVRTGAVKTFTLGGDLRGGRGDGGGSVTANSVGTAKIGGSLIGADNTSSNGSFAVLGVATSFVIGGSIVGGDAVSEDVGSNGLLSVNGNVGTLKLGHDLIGGTEGGGFQGFTSSMISVRGTVGTMTIGGSVIGDSTHAAYISVGGAGAVDAIKTLNVKGSLVFARLLAGYSLGKDQQNIDASIGSITIGGNLAASTITAGASKGTDGIAGTDDDLAASNVATIGSVKIGGAFQGRAGDSTTYYIYAPILNKLTIAKASYNHTQLKMGVIFKSIGSAEALSSM